MSQRIVVFCLGKSALALAQKIAKHLNAELHGKAERFNSETGQKQDDDAVSKFPVKRCIQKTSKFPYNETEFCLYVKIARCRPALNLCPVLNG
jgi:sortase (surface protein transpeptidase)